MSLVCTLFNSVLLITGGGWVTRSTATQNGLCWTRWDVTPTGMSTSWRRNFSSQVTRGRENNDIFWHVLTTKASGLWFRRPDNGAAFTRGDFTAEDRSYTLLPGRLLSWFSLQRYNVVITQSLGAKVERLDIKCKCKCKSWTFALQSLQNIW